MDELMSLLTKQALTGNTVNEIARNSNTTNDETRSVVSSALPLLLSALTSNSGSTNKKDDLSSLFSQINVTSAADEKQEQTEEAKAETAKVGNSILDAILGSTQTGILGQIATATGITGDKVKQILVFAAPLLLKKLGSLLSTNTASASSNNNKKDDNDMLSTLLGAALGGSTASSNNKKDDNNLLNSLLGAALGGNSTSSNSNKKDDNDLLSSLASAALSGLVNNGKK